MSNCHIMLLFVIGGKTESNKRLSSTELLKDGAWQYSVNLPEPLFGHCLVKINSSHSFLAGGRTAGRESEAAYLYSDNEGFVPQADMSTPRKFHSCGLNADGLIIVAGGMIINKDEALNSTEIFNLSTLTWETGPTLPAAKFAFGAAMISDNAGTFFIGGSTKIKSINWKDKTIHGSWIEVGEMSGGRRFFSVTKLSLNDTECERWVGPIEK